MRPRVHARANAAGCCWASISGMTSPAPIDDVPIGGEVIRLGQFLKFAGLLDSGGNVKEAIIDGFVMVNGEVDRRRGRQLHVGDIVTFEGRRVRVSA
jgi:ribosome-associated protein